MFGVFGRGKGVYVACGEGSLGYIGLSWTLVGRGRVWVIIIMFGLSREKFECIYTMLFLACILLGSISDVFYVCKSE